MYGGGALPHTGLRSHRIDETAKLRPPSTVILQRSSRLAGAGSVTGHSCRNCTTSDRPVRRDTYREGAAFAPCSPVTPGSADVRSTAGHRAPKAGHLAGCAAAPRLAGSRAAQRCRAHARSAESICPQGHPVAARDRAGPDPHRALDRGLGLACPSAPGLAAQLGRAGQSIPSSTGARCISSRTTATLASQAVASSITTPPLVYGRGWLPNASRHFLSRGP
jgi:hypothetical protein